jgi:hypothetical protein
MKNMAKNLINYSKNGKRQKKELDDKFQKKHDEIAKRFREEKDMRWKYGLR